MATSASPRPAETSRRDRLESWKEIAAFLNRSERTVRRWEEKEGLPVHRLPHDKRGSVYAFTRELDEWRESRRQLVESEPSEPAQPAVAARKQTTWAAAAFLLVLALVGSGIWWWTHRAAASLAYQPDPEAVRLTQLASFGVNAGRTQIETGIKYYQDAIRVDPGYAPAWVGLASGHFVRIWFGEVKAEEAMSQARQEAEQAKRLDPAAGHAWRVLAAIDHFVEWNHERAESGFRTAMQLSPTDAVACSWFADLLLDLRRFDEARVFYRRAQELSPRWLEPIAFTGNTHYFGGNPDLAIVEYKRVLESEPNFGLAHHFLGRALVARAEYEDGIAHLRKANDILGQVSFSLGDLAYGLAKGGRRAEAEALRNDLIQRRARGYFPAFPLAVIELGLGNHDAALDWLDRAADERNLGFYLPSADPNYDSVRSHPRFKAVMRRARLDGVG